VSKLTKEAGLSFIM